MVQRVEDLHVVDGINIFAPSQTDAAASERLCLAMLKRIYAANLKCGNVGRRTNHSEACILGAVMIEHRIGSHKSTRNMPI